MPSEEDNATVVHTPSSLHAPYNEKQNSSSLNEKRQKAKGNDEELEEDLALRSDEHVDDARQETAPSPRRRYAGEGTEESPYVVDWDGNDPEYPYNWSRSRRWILTYQVRSPQLSERCTNEALVGYWDIVRIVWIVFLYWCIIRSKSSAPHEHPRFDSTHFSLRGWVWIGVRLLYSFFNCIMTFVVH